MIRRRHRILCSIEVYSEKREVRARLRTHIRRILTNPGCKHQSIDSAQRRDHRADTGLQSMHENLKRELGPRVSSFMAETICRMSAESPEMPSRPDLRFNISSSCAPLSRSF